MAHDDLIGVMWPAPEAPDGLGLLGLAHGTSGTSLALLTAAAHGAREVQDLGWTAWDRERSWFDVREGNWPDLRVVGPGSEPSASRPSMVAWCHGALGIGCARLRLLHLHPDSPRRLALLAEVSVAVEAGRRKVMTARAALRDGTGTDASLCHGLTGVTELLLSASTLDGGASHARAAERVGDAVLAQHEQLGRWPCGLPAPHDEDPLEPPGLFLGLAGIALGLLRLGTGANVPGAALPQPIPGRSTSSSPPNPW